MPNKLLKIERILELVLVFIGMPLLIKFDIIPIPKLIVLLIFFLICLFILIRDKCFSRKIFGFNFFKNWKIIFLRFLIILVMSPFLIFLFRADSFFILIRERFYIWIIIMFFYPLFSAYPQELIYRAFFFHRYKFLINNNNLFISLNALLFAFMHIIFNNWLALVLTFFGSFLFSSTYLKSNSLLVVSIEHALYGNLIYTIGIGDLFYVPG